MIKCLACGEYLKADTWEFACECGQTYEHYTRAPRNIEEAGA